jgi:tRNA (guanine37-N1)-methyltransferase
VVKEGESLRKDSFFEGILDFPSYTKPEELDEEKVPAVLLSGDHARIARWRRKEALRRTLLRRPDLLAKAQLGEGDRQILGEIVQDG